MLKMNDEQNNLFIISLYFITIETNQYKYKTPHEENIMQYYRRNNSFRAVIQTLRALFLSK